MKSYNHLFEKVLDNENAKIAIQDAGKHKYKNNKRHRKLRYAAKHSEDFVPKLKQWIIEYEPMPHEKITINDGISAKKREIIVPTVKEVMIHHAAVNVLKPILSKGMYEHSYASIPGKGTHRAVKCISQWIYNDHANTKYCLQMDVKKFFDSIPQDKLLARLRKLIRDDKFFNLVKKIVTTAEYGVPLGFTTSQWFANWYLTPLDHKIKEEWGAKYYLRYMDDMIIFGSNKRELHKLKDKVEQYLNDALGLQLKNNWQVFLMDSVRMKKKKGHFLDFLGFKFYRTHIGIRGKVALKAQRKAKHIYKKGKANICDARQIVTYAGLIKSADCHKWFQEHIGKYVSIRKMRKKIARYDRQEAHKRNGKWGKRKYRKRYKKRTIAKQRMARKAQNNTKGG